MLKRLTLALGVLCLLPALSHGQPGKPQPESKDYNHILWKITPPNGGKPSYLFGTIHMLCKTDTFKTHALASAVAASDQVFMEMDMDDPQLQNTIALQSFNNSGKTLTDYLTANQYSKVDSFFQKELQMNVDLFKGVKLYVIYSMMTISETNEDCTDWIAYDQKIADYSQKYRKEVLGLEAPEEQISMFDKIPQDTLAQWIYRGAIQTTDHSYDTLRAYYITQRIEDLYHRFRDMSPEMMMYEKVFLTDRNQKWANKLNTIMPNRSCFIAVGAGHLGGPKGLIRLLEEKNYKFTPVTL
jgi:uncharacterized protein YbaP (TraB family)